MEIFEYKVDSETENMRMDRYLKKNYPDEPLSKIFQALRKGDVRVNDKKVKENYRLSLEDKITIKYLGNGKTPSKKTNSPKNKFSFDEKKYREMIIFENEDFFIVNKKERVPMHKGTGHNYGISEVFKQIYDNENINFANRLDYETSGLVIGCKNLKFLRYISEKIRKNEIEKKYIAVVHGNVKNEKFTIKNYLTTQENGVTVSKEKISKDSKESITNFKKISEKESLKLKNKIKTRDKNISVLDIDLVTGRKHQIRAQLANIGYPIVGDSKYGIKDNSDRFHLYCYQISFDKYIFSIKNDILL